MAIIDHASHQVGELGILRQVSGLWAPQREDLFTLDAVVTQSRPG